LFELVLDRRARRLRADISTFDLAEELDTSRNFSLSPNFIAASRREIAVPYDIVLTHRSSRRRSPSCTGIWEQRYGWKCDIFEVEVC
jgi:hypothetical protein